jgi:hypothetical protein
MAGLFERDEKGITIVRFSRAKSRSTGELRVGKLALGPRAAKRDDELR